MSYRDTDIHMVDKALKGPSVIHVYYAEPSWVLPNGDVKGWRLLIEKEKNQPQWVNCYTQSLTRVGLHADIEFYKNSRNERSIRIWKHKEY